MALEKTTEKFRWEDEIAQEENPQLKEIPATEREYDEYITNKINSAKDKWEKWKYLAKVAERDKFIEGGFPLQYYRTGDEIHWSTTLKN